MKYFMVCAFLCSTLMAGTIKLYNNSPEPIKGFWLQTPSNMGPNYVSGDLPALVYDSSGSGNQFYAGPTPTIHFAVVFSPNRTGTLDKIAPFVNKYTGSNFIVEVRTVTPNGPGTLLSSGTGVAPTAMTYVKVDMTPVVLSYNQQYYCVVYTQSGMIRWGYKASTATWSWSTTSGSTWTTKTDRGFQIKVYDVLEPWYLMPGQVYTLNSYMPGFYGVYVAGQGTSTYTAQHAEWGSDLGISDYGFYLDGGDYNFHYINQVDSWYEKKLHRMYGTPQCSTAENNDHDFTIYQIIAMILLPYAIYRIWKPKKGNK